MKATSLFPCITAAVFAASASVHASEPRSSTAAPTAGTAFVDAHTGALRDGTPTERAQLARRSNGRVLAWPATEAQAIQTEVRHDNGMVSMVVPSDRMVFTRAETNADGHVVVSHFDPGHDHGHTDSEERPHE